MEQRSLRSTATEPVLENPGAATTEGREPCRPCATAREAHALQLESSPHLPQLQKASNEDPEQPKVNNSKKKEGVPW